MQDIDIYRVAKMMIDQYGDSALLEIVHKIDTLRANGDKDGIAAWHKIADAIHWMQNSTLPDKEALQ